MMIEFDKARQAILIDSVPVGNGVKVRDVAGKIPGSLTEVPGQLEYCSFDGEVEGLRYEIGFKKGIFDSAILSVSLPWAGEWEELEKNEAWRKKQHETIMFRLFGCDHYEGPGLVAQMVRESRNMTEETRIYIP